MNLPWGVVSLLGLSLLISCSNAEIEDFEYAMGERMSSLGRPAEAQEAPGFKAEEFSVPQTPDYDFLNDSDYYTPPTQVVGTLRSDIGLKVDTDLAFPQTEEAIFSYVSRMNGSYYPDLEYSTSDGFAQAWYLNGSRGKAFIVYYTNDRVGRWWTIGTPQ